MENLKKNLKKCLTESEARYLLFIEFFYQSLIHNNCLNQNYQDFRIDRIKLIL